MSKSYLLKRPLDIIVAFTGMLFFLPLWGLFIILIWLEREEAVFYFQKRVGRDGKLFSTIKFRTLSPIKDGCLRSSRLGRLLRVTALDESLQLINILKGEMSFVGPRPLIPEEIEINKETSLRTLVRPGLTGLAQVLVHKNTPLLEKFKYDLWYIENQNLILDLKIIICSFMVSFKGGWESGRKNFTFYFHIFNIL